VIACAVTLLTTACVSLQRQPVPIDGIDAAVIAGMPDVRGWGDEYSESFQADVIQSVRDEHPDDFPIDRAGKHIYSMLAVSGGGADGAFGAGFLKGWTEAGTRPLFKAVTGVSTGALIAPFAFLGSDYDGALEELYTTVSSKDIFKRRSPFKILGNESVAITRPLYELISKHVDEAMIRRVAAAHARGRRLFVATTHLDAQRLMVWNMGAIALIEHSSAIELFRKVLLASASIPVAFPPVYFEVEVDGARFDEMHVDGGVIAEFFFFRGMIDLDAAARELQIDRHLHRRSAVYVIRNGKVGPEPKQIRRSFADIASRSLASLTKSVAMNDLYRVWTVADDNHVDFHYVGIPEDYEAAPKEPFDPNEMRRLFEVGRQLALEDEPWHSRPPWGEVIAAD
jgi:hypothetical protein